MKCCVPSYAALKKLRTKLREALVSDVGRKGRSTKGMSRAVARQWWLSQRVRCTEHVPLDFISCVQTCISSWISLGATSVRDHASSQRGFGGVIGASSLPALAADREPSFDLKTFLKKGILGGREEAPAGPARVGR